MSIKDVAQKIAKEINGEIKEKNGIYIIEALIAERKAFLSKKKLTYIAKFRIDEDKKNIRFTEMLRESGLGISGGDDFSMSPGFGFKTETYNTLKGAREGSIEEQSNLFGKKYEYKFDYSKIRKQIEEAAKSTGYTFTYLVTSIGL